MFKKKPRIKFCGIYYARVKIIKEYFKYGIDYNNHGVYQIIDNKDYKRILNYNSKNINQHKLFNYPNPNLNSNVIKIIYHIIYQYRMHLIRLKEDSKINKII